MSDRLPRIWIITDPDHPDGPIAPLRQALADCPRGLVGIQLRAPAASDRELTRWGRELRTMTERTGCALTINRRADIAKIVSADGVHLPERGLPPSILRTRWPELPMIGTSRHDGAGHSDAGRDGAHYAFLSPVFDVPGKGEPIGLEGFRAAIDGVGIPTYALGGMTADAVRPVLDAGGHGVAIRRAIYRSAEPRETLRRFLRELDKDLPRVE